MSKQNLTEIVVILDRSGSMDTIKNDAIGGFNTFLESQKNESGEAVMTVVQFDDQYLITVDGVDIQNVETLNEKTYVPRGMTALLDAIGKTIKTVGQRLSETTEELRPEKIIFVILTDGDENSSREFNKSQINEMITHQTEVYNWQFIFLSAGMDAVGTAASYGISSSNTMAFAANSRGMNSTYTSMNAAVSSMRSTGKIDTNWKDNVEN
jgi:uncharacterized protein YegL